MSLNYNLRNVRNFNTTCLTPEGYVGAVTETIIFYTMGVGIGEITEGNWADFYRRVYALEAVRGAGVIRDGRRYKLTPNDIREHIGLHTNASRLTATQFVKTIASALAEQADAKLEKVG